MAYKAPISKEEKKLDQTVQTMQALVRNEFRGDFVSAHDVEEARDFAKRYLAPMESMLSSMQSLRGQYNSLEKQFSSAMDRMPDWSDKALVYAGTGAAQVFGVIGSVGSIFSGSIANPVEVVETMTRERKDFFEGMDAAHKSVVGDPQGKTPEARKGSMNMYREAYSKVYFLENEMVGAVLEGNDALAKQKAEELGDALKGLKTASTGLNRSLSRLNAYTNSMEAIQTRVKKMTADMAIAVAGSLAAAAAITGATRGISSFYAATSNAGKLSTAGIELALETGVAGAETTYAGSAALGMAGAARGAKALEQAGITAQNGASAVGRNIRRAEKFAKKASDATSIEENSHNDLENSYELAPPSF
jgi:hypothetical protein